MPRLGQVIVGPAGQRSTALEVYMAQFKTSAPNRGAAEMVAMMGG